MEQHNFQIKSFLATLPAQLDAYAKRVAQMVEAHQTTAMAKEELEDTVVDLTETPYYEPPLVATPPNMQTAMGTEDTMEEQDQAEEITQEKEEEERKQKKLQAKAHLTAETQRELKAGVQPIPVATSPTLTKHRKGQQKETGNKTRKAATAKAAAK